jgi:hypothetical protein
VTRPSDGRSGFADDSTGYGPLLSFTHPGCRRAPQGIGEEGRGRFAAADPGPNVGAGLPMSAMREGLDVLTILTRPGPARSPGSPPVGAVVRSVTRRREQ